MVNWNRLEIVWDEWNKNHVLKHGVKKKEIENALRGKIYVNPITARNADKSMKKLYKKKVRI